MNTPLLLAVRQGRDEIARLLLHHGANIDVGDENQNTPLHQGRMTIAELLISQGAEVDALQEYQLTFFRRQRCP